MKRLIGLVAAILFFPAASFSDSFDLPSIDPNIQRAVNLLGTYLGNLPKGSVDLNFLNRVQALSDYPEFLCFAADSLGPEFASDVVALILARQNPPAPALLDGLKTRAMSGDVGREAAEAWLSGAASRLDQISVSEAAELFSKTTRLKMVFGGGVPWECDAIQGRLRIMLGLEIRAEPFFEVILKEAAQLPAIRFTKLRDFSLEKVSAPSNPKLYPALQNALEAAFKESLSILANQNEVNQITRRAELYRIYAQYASRGYARAQRTLALANATGIFPEIYRIEPEHTIGVDFPAARRWALLAANSRAENTPAIFQALAAAAKLKGDDREAYINGSLVFAAAAAGEKGPPRWSDDRRARRDWHGLADRLSPDDLIAANREVGRRLAAIPDALLADDFIGAVYKRQRTISWNRMYLALAGVVAAAALMRILLMTAPLAWKLFVGAILIVGIVLIASRFFNANSQIFLNKQRMQQLVAQIEHRHGRSLHQ